MEDETVELELYTYAETPNAYLVGDNAQEPEGEVGRMKELKLWLPKSQTVGRSGADARGRRTYSVTRWWADKNEIAD